MAKSILIQKKLSRTKRQLRIRKKLFGTSDRPRLSVNKTLNHVYVQVIDDVNQKTLFAFSTMSKEFRKISKTSGNVKSAQLLGEHFGPKIIEKGIKKIAFDRRGFLYHGRVKAVAESLRKSGLQF